MYLCLLLSLKPREIFSSSQIWCPIIVLYPQVLSYRGIKYYWQSPVFVLFTHTSQQSSDLMLYLLDGLTFRIILFHSIFYFFLTWCLVLAARCLAIDPSFGAVFCKMFWCFRAFFSKLLTPFRKLNQKDEISKGSSLAKNKSFSVSFFVSHSSKNELTNPLDLMVEFDLIEKVE